MFVRNLSLVVISIFLTIATLSLPALGQKHADIGRRTAPTEADLTALSSDASFVPERQPLSFAGSYSMDRMFGTASLSGVITVGAGGNYASLTNSGGAFQAINTLGLNGNLIINIISDLSAETGAVPLNESAGGFSVLIRPVDRRRTISGTSAASSGLIIIAGADNVTIDGSLGNTDDRGLTITNATTSSAVIWIQSGAASGANGNTIRNINLAGSAATNIVAGVLAGAPTFGSAATFPNSNNTIENISVIKAENAVYISGNSTTFDQSWTIKGNTFGSTVASEKLSYRGMLIGGVNNFAVTQNTIRGISSSTTSTSTMSGIQLANNCTNGSVTRNFITDVKHNNPTGFGANGILVGQTATAANVSVINNIVSDVATIGFNGIGLNDNAYGIVISSGSGYKLYNNSAYLTRYDSTIDSAITSALNITSAVTATGAIELINNFFGDNQLTGTRYGVINAATQAAAVFTTIDYNDYFGQFVGRQGSTNLQTLPLWQNATLQDAHSISLGPGVYSDIHLHITAGSNLNNKGILLAAVPSDFDGEPRPSFGGTEIGADEQYGRANLTGRILTAEGQPIKNVRIIATASAFSASTVTNGLGYFVFRDVLTQRDYTLTFISKQYAFSQPVVTLSHTSDNSSNYFADPVL